MCDADGNLFPFSLIMNPPCICLDRGILAHNHNDGIPCGEHRRVYHILGKE